MVPIKEGKGEVIGEVISIKEYSNDYDYGRSSIFKMLIEDFKGYRVFGTIPAFFLEENIKVGDFVKFNAKLKQKELEIKAADVQVKMQKIQQEYQKNAVDAQLKAAELNLEAQQDRPVAIG